MRDLLAAAFLAAFALLFIVPAIGYGVGALSRPGAGGVPMVIGFIMLGFALVIAIGGVRNLGADGQIVTFDAERLRHIGFVMAALAIFALSIERFGLLPSTVAAVLVSAMADRDSRFLPSLILAAVMCAIVTVIFKLGLQVNTPLFESPF